MSDRRSIRVLVVDDQAIVRGGLRMTLDAQPDIEVVGEAENGDSGVALAVQLDPDVVLMDIRMPVLDGIAATRALRALDSRAGVLVLTTYAVDENVYEALRAGASGFFAKTDPPEQIVAAVRSAAATERQLGPDAMRLVVDRFLAQPAPRVTACPELKFLTDREREVLLLLGSGLTNVEIAGQLTIGDATVKTHVARIMSKLGLRDRVQAVVYCYEHGLLTPGGQQHR